MAVTEKVQEATAGTTVKVWGDEQTVAPPCQEESGYWYCATHEDSFRGNWMVTAHTEDNKRHLLVWVCSQHGAEQALS